MLLLLLPSAFSATPTELPPFLRGDVSIGYSYDRLSGGLQERIRYGSCDDDAGEPCVLDVGDRTLQDHRMSYALTFAAYHGLALRLEVPHYVNSSVNYANTGEMLFDAASGSGTYKGSELPEGTVQGYKGAGIGGLWIEVVGTPFSENFTKRNNKATWLLAGGIRTPDGTDHWTFQEGSVASGAGPGGSALRLRTAFSKRFGASEPYMSLSVTGENPYYRRQVNAENGAILQNPTADGGSACTTSEDFLSSSGDCTPIFLGTEVQTQLGVQLSTAENPSSGGKFSTDLHTGFRYNSWAAVPSGSYLPEVLTVTEGTPVLQAESLEVGVGLRLDVRFFTYLEWRIGADAYYHAPQRIESVYAVYTSPDTLRVTAATELVVRVR